MTEPIIVIVEGGLVQDVFNLPKGVSLEVHDYDDVAADEPNAVEDERGDYYYRLIFG